MTQVYDETEYIYSALDLVKQNIFIGSALTMIVLMMFLHLGMRTIVLIPLIAVERPGFADLAMVLLGHVGSDAWGWVLVCPRRLDRGSGDSRSASSERS